MQASTENTYTNEDCEQNEPLPQDGSAPSTTPYMWEQPEPLMWSPTPDVIPYHGMNYSLSTKSTCLIRF